MSKDILSALEEQFNQECLAINVKEEYPDYLGTEQWIIITDLSDEELTARYGFHFHREGIAKGKARCI